MKEYQGKRVLVTGACGSVGSALVNELRHYKCKSLTLLDNNETELFFLQSKLASYSNSEVYLCDIRDRNSIDYRMRSVDVVIHAAALKQVPSCEFYPMQAVKTNVIGTENVLNSAIKYGVKKVIALSTDKAVYPINAMGISKAMMERVIVSKGRNDTGTTIACTRYGNVMASRGSVIPLFINQIRNNKPITITDPEMTRFMMSLDQAVDLVLFAFENGNSGDIFVQKAPAATVKLLAETISELLNLPNHPLKIIGTRHGEKLYETLLTKEEMVKAIDMKNYYRIPADNRDLNYNKFFEEGEEIITQAGEYHSHNTHRLNRKELMDLLVNLREIKADIEEFSR